MDKYFDLDTLIKLTSEEAVQLARKSMDARSVSAFKLDARGRMEAGIRPAPPSTEPAAYARVSWRGKRFSPECRTHGKGKWCLHSLILALYHVGADPIIRAPSTPETVRPKLGFQLVLSFSQDCLQFRVKGSSGASFVANPLHFIARERVALDMTEAAVELLTDLAEERGDAFDIARVDGASVLQALHRTPLVDSKGQPYRRSRLRGEAPRLTVRIEGDQIVWEAAPAIAREVVFLPGWPGFLVSENQLVRFDGYLPDFQFLVGLKPGALPLTPANLKPFLTPRHRISWLSAKPKLLSLPEPMGVNLDVQGRDLKGALGLWLEDAFFPLRGLERNQQVLHGGKQVVLLDTTDYHMSRLRGEVSSARLPVQGSSFTIRESMAPEFLSGSPFPKGWRAERVRADHHFGQNRLAVATLWSDGGMPRYRIGDELFDHDALSGKLLDGNQGARLDDGRVLNFDAGEVRRNQHLIYGAAALHEDDSKRAHLMARLQGQPLEEEPTKLPEHWQKLLRPYQSEGVRWMLANLRREEPALLADDMGLGKTIQTLAVLDILKTDLPRLIVVPTSLLGNWRDEARRFCPKRRLMLHHGPKRAREAEALQQADVVITSYGTVLRDIEMLYDVHFQLVVLDEAQAIKNPASRTTRAVCELWCDGRMALTGTPVENRMTELWSIFHFLAPGYLGEEEDMREVTMPGTPAYEALKTMVKPFLKRRLKQDVATELPPKQEILVKLPLEEEQATLYHELRRNSHAVLKNGKAGALSVLTQLLRLRQACCHPGLLEEARARSASNKLSFLMEQLEEVTASGHAALVFSQFTRFLGLVRFALEEAEIPYLYLDGRTRDRAALVSRFQEGEAPVFLISLKAGGVGLNLTRASYVYHLDPWWNPAVEAQATDRAHRIGQTRQVFSYKLVSENTVEERILQLQQSKKFLAEGLWQEPEKLIASLDLETLMGLVG